MNIFYHPIYQISAQVDCYESYFSHNITFFLNEVSTKFQIFLMTLEVAPLVSWKNLIQLYMTSFIISPGRCIILLLHIFWPIKRSEIAFSWSSKHPLKQSIHFVESYFSKFIRSMVEHLPYKEVVTPISLFLLLFILSRLFNELSCCWNSEAKSKAILNKPE